MRKSGCVSAVAIFLLVGCSGGGSAPALDTVLHEAPQEPFYEGMEAAFVVGSNLPASAFEARMDGGNFVAIERTHVVEGLAAGTHRFEVCAVDSTGARDPTPAVHVWEVGPPVESAITEGPPAQTTATDATFVFVSTIEDATFRASLDGADLGLVESPFTIAGLAVGPHHFELRAIAPGDVVETDPSVHDWTIIVPLPPAPISIDFPPRASATSAGMITVRGRAPAGAEAVVVGGVSATSADGFATWSATVPLAVGTTRIAIEAYDAGGAPVGLAAERTVQRLGPALRMPIAVAYDRARDRLLVVDDARRAVLAVDRRTGERTLFCDDWGTIVDGGSLFSPRPLAIDPAGDRLLVQHRQGAISAVDLATGEQRVLIEREAARDRGVWLPLGIDYAADGRIFVSDHRDCAVHEFHAESGAYRLVSAVEEGGGDDIGRQTDLVWDAGGDRILVADQGSHGIVAVDPASGFRSAFDGVLLQPHALALDAARDHVYVLACSSGTLDFLDLAQGERYSVAVNGIPGSGNPYGGIAIDSAGHRAFLTHPVFDALFAVDLGHEKDNVTRISEDPIGSGPLLGGYDQTGVYGSTWDAKRDRTLLTLRVVRGALVDHAVFAVDRESGARSVVSSTATFFDEHDNPIDPQGTGPALVFSGDIAMDPNRDRILVLDEWAGAIVAIDPGNGDRTIVAQEAGGVRWHKMALDRANDRAVLIAGDHRYLAVDLATGVIETLTTPDSLAADRCGGVRDLAFVPGDPRLHVLVAKTGSILAADMATGETATVGEAGGDAHQMAVDAAGNRLLVLGPDSLHAIDLDDGARVAISRGGQGHGEFPVGCSAISYDSTRDLVHITTQGSVSGTRGVFALDLRTGTTVIASRE